MLAKEKPRLREKGLLRVALNTRSFQARTTLWTRIFPGLGLSFLVGYSAARYEQNLLMAQECDVRKFQAIIGIRILKQNLVERS